MKEKSKGFENVWIYVLVLSNYKQPAAAAG